MLRFLLRNCLPLREKGETDVRDTGVSLYDFCSFNLFSFYKGGLLFQQQTDLKDSSKFMLVGVDAIAFVFPEYL